MKGPRGKNVIVTGGTSGIGQAIAVRFGAEGANVAMSGSRDYRRQPEDAAETDRMVHQGLEQCVQDVCARGVNHVLVQADVSREVDVVGMVREVLKG